jgi:hypothetical protein
MILPQQWLPELITANKATLNQVDFLEGVVLGLELNASYLLGWHSTTKSLHKHSQLLWTFFLFPLKAKLFCVTTGVLAYLTFGNIL